MAKPTDLQVYVERKHQDGHWRLVFFDDLWADVVFNKKPVPAMTALGDLGERRPTLFWYLAHVDSTNAQMNRAIAEERKAKDVSHPEDAYVLADKPLLRMGVPEDVGDWYPTLHVRFTPKTWAVLTPKDLDAFQAMEHMPSILERWFDNAALFFDARKDLFSLKTTFGPTGLPFEFDKKDDPFSEGTWSSHQRLQGHYDFATLLPIGPETIRILVAFD